MNLPINKEQLQAEVNGKLVELFKGRDEAYNFICRYIDYCHVIDDLVDEETTIAMIEQTTTLASVIFNLDYWKKYGTSLYLLHRIIHHTYFDSVQWERAEEQWKKDHARVLNHCGYNMLFAVVLIEFGEEKLKEVGMTFREYAHITNNE